MLNRARIEASNNRIENLRFRRGLRRLALACAAVGAPMSQLYVACRRFGEAMRAAAFPDKPRYVPWWLWVRWLQLKYRYADIVESL